MILNFDRGYGQSAEQMVQSLMESTQMAFDTLERKLGLCGGSPIDDDGNVIADKIEANNLSINGIPIKGCHKIRISKTGEEGTYTEDSIGYYMTSTQRIYLEEKVSEQLNGIILVWSFYNGSVQDWGWNFTVIPKAWIPDNPNNMGMTTFMVENATVGNVGAKYFYVRDNRIVGHDDNNKTGTGTSAIKYSNNKFVLRWVYGF